MTSCDHVAGNAHCAHVHCVDRVKVMMCLELLCGHSLEHSSTGALPLTIRSVTADRLDSCSVLDQLIDVFYSDRRRIQ